MNSGGDAVSMAEGRLDGGVGVERMIVGTNAREGRSEKEKGEMNTSGESCLSPYGSLTHSPTIHILLAATSPLLQANATCFYLLSGVE